MRFAAASLVGFAFCAAQFLATRSAVAVEIQINVGDCKSGVQLVARDAPLDQLLQRLAKSLHFQLHLETSADRIVNASIAAQAPELIARLAAQERVMVSQIDDPRCPGRSRVARVWVLPQGLEVATSTQEPMAPKRPVTEIATREQMRGAQAKSQKLKEEYEAYVRAHGKPPPGEEEEVAKP